MSAPLVYDDRGHGRVVVFVHGHPFDRSMWAPQVAALEAHFRLVIPDLRGYGDSPATRGPVSMAALAGDVRRLLDELDIDKAAVVGLSMGGLVAMELAIAEPARWWALGLVATTADPPTADERRERLAMADRLEREGTAPLVEHMRARLFGPACPPVVAARVEAMMRRANATGAAAALRGRAERPDYRAALKRLRLPALVCVGTHDFWSTTEVTERLLATLHEPRLVVLLEVGHLPNMENPALFNSALLDFLQPASDGQALARP